MAKEREEVDVEILISLVEEKPEIWDKSIEDYKDRNKTIDAWNSVCCQLKPDFDLLSDREKKLFAQMVVKRWKNIRDHWIKWKKREKNLRKPGSSASHARKYIYHGQLKFLEKVLVHGQTNSNVDAPANDEHIDNGKSQHVQLVADKMTANANEKKQILQASPTKTTKVLPAQQSTAPTSTKKRKQSFDEFELKMLKALEKQEPKDRHMMFFQGIIPSLRLFTEEQTLDFQMAVLQLVKNIKNGLPGLSLYTSRTSDGTAHPQQSRSASSFQYSHQNTSTAPTSHYSQSSNFNQYHATISSHITIPQPLASPTDTTSTASDDIQSTASEDVPSPAFVHYSDIDF